MIREETRARKVWKSFDVYIPTTQKGSADCFPPSERSADSEEGSRCFGNLKRGGI